MKLDGIKQKNNERQRKMCASVWRLPVRWFEPRTLSLSAPLLHQMIASGFISTLRAQVGVEL